MRPSSLLATVVLTANSALAAYNIVHNKCEFSVWVTSVAKDIGETMKVAPGALYAERQHKAENGTGTAIKITKTQQGLFASEPVLIFGYSYKKATELYYDLSTAYGFDFWGKKLRIHNIEDKPVPEIVWNGEPEPDHTAAYLGGEASLTLELCDDFAQRI